MGASINLHRALAVTQTSCRVHREAHRPHFLLKISLTSHKSVVMMGFIVVIKHVGCQEQLAPSYVGKWGAAAWAMVVEVP